MENTFLYFEWLEEHNLGRKRLLDAMLASTMQQGNDITSVLTLDLNAFSVCENFTFPK